MQRWVKVFEDKQGYKAEIVKDKLKEAGIEAVVLNKKDAAYTIFGHYEVLVPPAKALTAIRIVEHDIDFT